MCTDITPEDLNYNIIFYRRDGLFIFLSQEWVIFVPLWGRRGPGQVLLPLPLHQQEDGLHLPRSRKLGSPKLRDLLGTGTNVPSLMYKEAAFMDFYPHMWQSWSGSVSPTSSLLIVVRIFTQLPKFLINFIFLRKCLGRWRGKRAEVIQHTTGAIFTSLSFCETKDSVQLITSIVNLLLSRTALES